jgi:8-oxo-dGTP pyrophosphatase MutT (NUDIX family)
MLDPRLDRIAAALGPRPHQRVERAPQHRDAAVALLIRPGDELELLLIKRAEFEGDPWSGHIALPGGRRAPGDADLLATAQRETLEETGIPLASVGLPLGSLDELAPSSPRLPPIVISPYVLAVPPETRAVPDGIEVDAVLWVPLAALRDRHAISDILIELGDGTRAFPSFRYGEHVIWGLTHRILTQFLEIAGEAGV